MRQNGSKQNIDAEKNRKSTIKTVSATQLNTKLLDKIMTIPLLQEASFAVARASVLTALLLYQGLACDRANAQPTPSVKTEQAAIYRSSADDLLTIKKISVLPAADNVSGIFARPLEAHLIEVIKSQHRFDFVEIRNDAAGLINGNSPFPQGFGENAEATRSQIANLTSADGVLQLQIARNEKSLTLKLNLFLRADGMLLGQETNREISSNDVNQSKAALTKMVTRIISKIPYQGIVLSRQNLRVTVNLGKDDGLVADQIISVVQLLKLNRHPKFGFLISTEKEILGKIKILKVDESLSFGAIISEKDRGAIQKGAKVASVENVNYAEPTDLETQIKGRDINDRADAKVSFGENAKEWIPKDPPAFGLVGLRAGLGSFGISSTLNSGPIEGSAIAFPSLAVLAELWITQNWIVKAELAQGIATTENGRSGSNPAKLSHALSSYSLSMVYNFLMKNDFFGPRLQARLGLMTYQDQVTTDSSPRSFTSSAYSGYLFGFAGSLPVFGDHSWYVGGEFDMILLPKFSESPVTSGANSSPTSSQFSFFTEYSLNQNMRAIASLDFGLYTTSLSGTGSRVDSLGSPETSSSISNRVTTLTGGIVYMF
jgi:hypothetical protein